MKQNIDVKKRYRMIRKRQLVVSIIFLLTGFGVMLLMSTGFMSEEKIVGFIFIPLFVIYGIFVVNNWRCPSCNKSLKRTWNPKCCPNCGIELR